MPPDSSELPLGNGVEDSVPRGAAGAVADRRSLFWWRCGQLLLLLVLVSLVATMLLPAILRIGPATRMSQCRTNIRAICAAVRQYADEHGAYPPAYTVDADGRRLHSWRTLLLPYLGQQAIYSQIDLKQPCHAPVHDAVRSAVIPAYHCPSLEQGSTTTGYLTVVSEESLLGPGRANPTTVVVQPLDLLLVCIEVHATRSGHWMSPFDLSADEFLRMGNNDGAAHTERESDPWFHAGYATGMVESMSAEVSRKKRQAMISAIKRAPVDTPD